jgi:DNA-directed RNA polymerase subunit RPC12/RpoP
MPQAVTCHCGKKFDATPAEGQRRVNCPTCNSVIFLPEPASETGDDVGYGLAATEEEHQAFRRKRRQGEPDWLQRYRDSRETVKGEQSRLFTTIAGLAGVNATLDPIGAALYVAVTHSDAETSVAALAKVAISRHPVYTALARTLLSHVGPSDATGAQQLLELIGETEDGPSRQVLLDALERIGPTPLVQIRVLLELLPNLEERLQRWSIESLRLVGRAAGHAHEPLWDLHRREPGLRLPVLGALAAIGREPHRTVEALPQFLQQHDAGLRREAIAIARSLGAAGNPLVPLLKTVIAKDPEPDLRKLAADAAAAILTAVRNQPASGSTPAPADGLLRVQCQCGKKLQAKAALAGKTARCPACGQSVTLPAPPPPPTTVASPAAAADKECPRCFAMAPAAQILCLSCGYDFRTGKTVKVSGKPTAKPPSPPGPGKPGPS